MKVDDVARNHRLEEDSEQIRQARRRERAFLRSPVTAPAHYPGKALRRHYLEAIEEFQQRR